MIPFDRFRAILCLNGDLPQADFYPVGLPIIAADGAANTLMNMGVRPDLVIGDLDSTEPHYLDQLETIRIEDQDTHDFQKALSVLESQHLLPALIVGMNGGCIDHILNNINIFSTTTCAFYAEPVYGFMLAEKDSVTLEVPHQSTISLMALPRARVSSTGLHWELQNAELCFPGNHACSNRSTATRLSLEVHEGLVLVMIYLAQ